MDSQQCLYGTCCDTICVKATLIGYCAFGIALICVVPLGNGRPPLREAKCRGSQCPDTARAPRELCDSSGGAGTGIRGSVRKIIGSVIYDLQRGQGALNAHDPFAQRSTSPFRCFPFPCPDFRDQLHNAQKKIADR